MPCPCLHYAPQLGKGDYDPEPDMQVVAVYRSFNSSCTFDQCYAMGSICREELASDGKNETDQFCRRWCCALLVASGRSGDLSAKAARLRANDDVPMVIIGDRGCKSVSDGATDEWCTNTCKGGSQDGDVLSTCPTNLCECDDDDTEEVDYDPIQRANEPDAPADASTPTLPGQAQGFGHGPNAGHDGAGALGEIEHHLYVVPRFHGGRPAGREIVHAQIDTIAELRQPQVQAGPCTPHPRLITAVTEREGRRKLGL